MSARDLYHNAVLHALDKDGWTITDDPFRLNAGGHDTYIDLGAERLVAAEKGTEKIAVEIKTFGGYSQLTELHRAIGQFVFYRAFLSRKEPERVLFLAVPEDVFRDIFEEPVGRTLIEDGLVRVLGFNPTTEVIVGWKP